MPKSNATALLSPFYDGPFALRLSDNSIYEPSYPDCYTEADAMVDLFVGNASWYFRRIVRLPRRWWQVRRRWKRTGIVWLPVSGNEFRVINTAEANRICK